MRVGINETGNGDCTLAILDREAGFGVELSEAGNLAVPDHDVTGFARHGPYVAQKKIVHGTHLSFGLSASRSQSPEG